MIKESRVEARHHAVAIKLGRATSVAEQPPTNHVRSVSLHLGEIGVDCVIVKRTAVVPDAIRVDRRQRRYIAPVILVLRVIYPGEEVAAILPWNAAAAREGRLQQLPTNSLVP